MRKPTLLLAVLAAVALTSYVGQSLAGGVRVASSDYQGKDPKAAAASLLGLAESMAGKGTWELIGIGRVYYLSGDKEKGQAYFDRATSFESGLSEWRKIGKVYAEAKDYDKAIGALEKAVAIKEDDTALAELAVVYNLAGRRDKAEEAIGRSIGKDPSDTWNTIDMAGSYLGVKSH